MTTAISTPGWSSNFLTTSQMARERPVAWVGSVCRGSTGSLMSMEPEVSMTKAIFTGKTTSLGVFRHTVVWTLSLLSTGAAAAGALFKLRVGAAQEGEDGEGRFDE